MPLGFRPSDQGDPHRAAHDRPELERILENHYDDATRYVPPSLINDIHDGGRAIAIVIDDWHRMTSIETVAVMTRLVANVDSTRAPGSPSRCSCDVWPPGWTTSGSTQGFPSATRTARG